MKTFAAGVITGAGVLALVLCVAGDSDVPTTPCSQALDRTRSAPIEPTTGGAPRPALPHPTLRGSPSALDDPPFAPGEAWLRIGEGYVFGESFARGQEASEGGDIRCLDIEPGISLACPYGASPALAPLSAVGMPDDPASAAVLVRDAPVDLPAQRLHLLQRVSPQQAGIGFARSRDGRCYLLHLAGLDRHCDALHRRALVRYTEVPQIAGGGELALPTVAGQQPVPVSSREGIRKALSYGRSLPSGRSFVSFIQGAYSVVENLLPETCLGDRRYLVIDAPLRSKVVFKGGGGLYAAAGIDHDGVVVLDSYSGVATAGDMGGRVDFKSYGYLYVDGDLTGTVTGGCYATIVIEGDLVGTLEVRSYTDLLLRGAISGTLDCRGSGWCTFYFERYHSRSDLDALGRGFGGVTLHVRESDLPAGKHTDVGSWREVIVGDPLWEKLAR